MCGWTAQRHGGGGRRQDRWSLSFSRQPGKDTRAVLYRFMTSRTRTKILAHENNNATAVAI